MTRRVVTLPPSVTGPAALEWARAARRSGADVLELRNDLHPAGSVEVAALASELPLLLSERPDRIAPEWLPHGWRVDQELTRELTLPGDRLVVSHHSERPLSPDEALRLWSGHPLPPRAWVKHIEPVGEVKSGWRILETRRRLAERFGADRVTALLMGPLALPFRAVAAEGNALDYVALEPRWQAAPGQRLLADAVRSARAQPGIARLGILGSGISLSRSPRIHRQPFDRIDLPAETAIGPLVDALLERYRGLAVTSPFKLPVATHVRAELPSVNTLFRTIDDGAPRWLSANTDVEGAKVAIERLGARTVTVLGGGGATEAVRLAARALDVELKVLKRADLGTEPVRGAVVWTWPEDVEPPTSLRFESSRVALIAYGERARRIAFKVRSLGGEPVFLGAAWFVAQARAQRDLWEAAR